ncbi:MAG TPA: hypothetical protein VM870_00425 [Pyrinomonadaceae bacterium]|nr:hypothetical protein [Pyrinomonadaceae bacterium]
MAANVMELTAVSEAEREQRATWATSTKADEMLCLLSRQQRIDLHGKLRDYVRWLLTEQSDETSLLEFEEERAQFEAQLKERVNTGSLTGPLAKQKRGDWIWQQALEMGRATAVFFTVYKSIDEGVVNHFQTNAGAAARRMVGEQYRLIAAEQADKLRNFIANPFETT